MAHASDANKGLLHLNQDYTNPTTGGVYQSNFNGLKKSEWRAVYRENIIRGQLGLPLRTHYGHDVSTGTPVGIGPSLIHSFSTSFFSLPINMPLNYR
jgi:hypothetical protein